MSVIVYTEISNGKIKKSSLEGVNYGNKIAVKLNTSVTAIVSVDADAAATDALGKAGAKKVYAIESGDIFESGQK